MYSINIDGIDYDLSHLKEFSIELDNIGKDGNSLKISVFLSRHTISESCSDGQHDLLDEINRPRKFCKDRYSFSLILPDLIKKMIKENYFCWESKDRNTNMNFATLDIPPMEVMNIRSGRYKVIYFYLYPDKEKAAIRFFVTSCYEKDLLFKKKVRRYNMHTLLRKCLYDQKRLP